MTNQYTKNKKANSSQPPSQQVKVTDEELRSFLEKDRSLRDEFFLSQSNDERKTILKHKKVNDKILDKFLKSAMKKAGISED